MNSAIVRFFAVFMGIFMVLGPSAAGAHSGGTDASGGHYNRKTGEYHYHHKPSADQRTYTPERSSPARSPQSNQRSELTTSISATERESRINEYFRSANENVGALDCGLRIHARDVNGATKNGVRWGYGNKCTICGGTVKLEVDHRRALMNGGTNDILNLGLLCDDCHKIKTKYDNSLRRKRESVCRRK